MLPLIILFEKNPTQYTGPHEIKIRRRTQNVLPFPEKIVVALCRKLPWIKLAALCDLRPYTSHLTANTVIEVLLGWPCFAPLASIDL
jgi:hypothetical protein